MEETKQLEGNAIPENIEVEKEKSDSYDSVKGLDNNSDNKDEWEDYQKDDLDGDRGLESNPYELYDSSTGEYGDQYEPER